MKVKRSSAGAAARFTFALPLLLAGIGFVAADAAIAQDFIVYKVGGDECPYHDIQAALDDAAAHPGTDYVWIANTASYTDQHIVVTNDDVIIEGGFTDCLQNEPTTQTTLLGADGHSVLEIEGTSNVYLADVVLTGAVMDSSHRGGGIYFGGQGSLEIANTTISFNESGYGAGINMNGGDGPATLTLDAGTMILSNTASVSGGGIRMEGAARLLALAPQTLIAFNHAPNGYGGGLEVIGPARADIGSPGYNGLAVIYDNDAQYGGGIDAIAISDRQHAIVRLFTTDRANPVQIANNVASHAGGGVYLKPLDDETFSVAFSVLCATDFRIEDNIAQEGSAVYADTTSTFTVASIGADVELNADGTGGRLCSQPEPPQALGALACAAGTTCSVFAGNIAEDADGNPTGGSTLLIQTNATLQADRIQATGNVGAHVLRQLADDASGNISLTDCLITDNALTAEVIDRTDGDEGILVVDSCTFARNAIGAPTVFYGLGSFYLLNSIIDQPGVLTMAPPATLAAYILTNDASTLPQTPDIVTGAPTFIDATHGDFHLRPDSLGIDFAPSESLARAHPFDLDHRTRVVDLWNTPNQSGAMDLGAYEIQLDTIFPCARDDTIFCDGFER